MAIQKFAKLLPLRFFKGMVSAAVIVLFDPAIKRTISAAKHHMNVDYNAFEGFEVTGEPISVMVRGEWVIKNRKFVGELGSGKYLRRKLSKKLESSLSNIK